MPAGIALAAVVAIGLNRPEIDGKTPAERIQQIAELADRSPRGAAEAIARAAAGDADPSVRQAALVALGRFVSPAHRAVVDAAIADGDPQVRSGAAVTLGLYGDDRAADALGRLATEDASEKVRLAAATGLGRLDRPRALGWLVRVMESPQVPPAVRREALDAVGRRLKIRFVRPPAPGTADWGQLVQKIRSSPVARAALAEMDRGGKPS
ncbi:MAG TPA: HEAT repeat domain-containing protein [Phycisphaerae bacterium]|nr:HEAT repeat domain-containing protein [Phycisphaerae bacterium]